MIPRDPIATRALEREIWNSYASAYNESVEISSFVYRSEREAFARWVVDEVNHLGLASRDVTLIDIGCGGGASSAHFIEAGYRVVGFDLAEETLALAKKDFPSGAWVQGLVEQPPFADSCFDVVVATLSLHHLVDPSDLFKLIDRCVRPGGFFFILEYSNLAKVGVRSDIEKGLSTRCGDLVRKGLAWKNRRALADLPQLEARCNPSHQLREWDEIYTFMVDPERYRLHQRNRGVIFPAFKRVLDEGSVLDRSIARLANAIDRRIEGPNGYFQWISGRLPAR